MDATLGSVLGILVVCGAPTVMFVGYHFAKTRERIARMQLEARKTPDQDLAQQLDALRQEVARLRDTSTQFDVSHDHALERIDQRLRSVESKTASTISIPAEPPSLQTIERH
jgi:TolA-binding protein